MTRRINVFEVIQKVGIRSKGLKYAELLKVYVVEEMEDLSVKVKNFIHQLKVKNEKHNRKFDRLLEREESWLSWEFYTGPLIDAEMFQQSLSDLDKLDVNEIFVGDQRRIGVKLEIGPKD